MIRFDSTGYRAICDEVAQHAKADVARLLGMELDPRDRTALDDGGNGSPWSVRARPYRR